MDWSYQSLSHAFWTLGHIANHICNIPILSPYALHDGSNLQVQTTSSVLGWKINNNIKIPTYWFPKHLFWRNLIVYHCNIIAQFSPHVIWYGIIQFPLMWITKSIIYYYEYGYSNIQKPGWIYIFILPPPPRRARNPILVKSPSYEAYYALSLTGHSFSIQS